MGRVLHARRAVGRRRPPAGRGTVVGRLIALLVRDAVAGRLVDGFLAREGSIGQRPPDAPDDHYTFAGEIPWLEAFGQAAHEGAVPYQEVLKVDSGPDIEVEILAH